MSPFFPEKLRIYDHIQKEPRPLKFLIKLQSDPKALASTKGAAASTTVYSLVETAKANGLNVYKYLQYLLQYMPDVDYKNNPEELEDLMPWSSEVQNNCK